MWYKCGHEFKAIDRTTAKKWDLKKTWVFKIFQDMKWLNFSINYIYFCFSMLSIKQRQQEMQSIRLNHIELKSYLTIPLKKSISKVNLSAEK